MDKHRQYSNILNKSNISNSANLSVYDTTGISNQYQSPHFNARSYQSDNSVNQ